MVVVVVVAEQQVVHQPQAVAVVGVLVAPVQQAEQLVALVVFQQLQLMELPVKELQDQ
jgi:hypothetical protein